MSSNIAHISSTEPQAITNLAAVHIGSRRFSAVSTTFSLEHNPETKATDQVTVRHFSEYEIPFIAVFKNPSTGDKNKISDFLAPETIQQLVSLNTSYQIASNPLSVNEVEINGNKFSLHISEVNPKDGERYMLITEDNSNSATQRSPFCKIVKFGTFNTIINECVAKEIATHVIEATNNDTNWIKIPFIQTCGPDIDINNVEKVCKPLPQITLFQHLLDDSRTCIESYLGNRWIDPIGLLHQYILNIEDSLVRSNSYFPSENPIGVRPKEQIFHSQFHPYSSFCNKILGIPTETCEKHLESTFGVQKLDDIECSQITKLFQLLLCFKPEERSEIWNNHSFWIKETLNNTEVFKAFIDPNKGPDAAFALLDSAHYKELKIKLEEENAAKVLEEIRIKEKLIARESQQRELERIRAPFLLMTKDIGWMTEEEILLVRKHLIERIDSLWEQNDASRGGTFIMKIDAMGKEVFVDDDRINKDTEARSRLHGIELETYNKFSGLLNMVNTRAKQLGLSFDNIA